MVLIKPKVWRQLGFAISMLARVFGPSCLETCDYISWLIVIGWQMWMRSWAWVPAHRNIIVFFKANEEHQGWKRGVPVGDVVDS